MFRSKELFGGFALHVGATVLVGTDRGPMAAICTHIDPRRGPFFFCPPIGGESARVEGARHGYEFVLTTEETVDSLGPLQWTWIPV